MNQDQFWRRVHANEQAVAEKERLVGPGENYRLTGAQERAIADIEGWLAEGERQGRPAGSQGGSRGALLEAPTGAGKTAVEFRVALGALLRRQVPVVVIAPTRDLVRQHVNYYKTRLAGTPVRLAELHGGVAPRERSEVLRQLEQGLVPLVIGSGLLLKEENYRQWLRRAGLLIVDDVHAFDPIEHLPALRSVHAPGLFATATPSAVEGFLREKGALERRTTLDMQPFAGPPTATSELRARYGTDPLRQVLLAEEAIRRHIASDGRIFVISRTRADVPRLTRFLEERFGIPVTMLHGEMVDTQEQAKRLQRFKQYSPDRTRVAMMARFQESLPAILVGTNMVGAGLDVPNADLIVITDADGFGPADLEQLIGRVGRRDRASEAYLVRGTLQKTGKRRR